MKGIADVNIPKMQLELLLLVEQHNNLDQVVASFLPPALKILNCTSGHLWLFNKKENLPLKSFSFPNAEAFHSKDFKKSFEEILLKSQEGKNDLRELQNLLPNSAFYHYVFPLKNAGMLLFQSEIEHSYKTLEYILEPVVSKLAKICDFCFDYQLSEQKFNKIFEESPVSLWEQDLSITEKELKNLELKNIKDIKKHFSQNPQLPLQLLKKLKIVNINQATLDMYEAKSKEEFIARVDEIYDASEGSREGLINAAAAILKGEKGFSFEAVNYTLNKKKLNVIIRSSICSTEAGFSHVFSSIQDITEQKQATAQYQYLASHDPLTGLPNRRCYESSFIEAIKHAQHHEKMFGLLYVDIDYFKKINDSFGHVIGDNLLREYAHKLKEIFPHNLVARLGGDEFAIIIEEIKDATSAGEIADAIKKQIDTTYKIGEHYIDVISSIGIAVYPIAGTDFISLNKNADIALYAVKNSGRNNYKYFTPGDKYYDLINLETELTSAIEKQQIFLCYQPIYNYPKAQLVGLETLTRWQHPKLGLIMPNIFIQLAEDDGTIIPLGYWIFEEACKQYMRWFPEANKNHAIKLKINVSSNQLNHRNFFTTIAEIINKTQINPKNLELELTEMTFINQPKLVEKLLQQIKELGISLAIDDLGIGYSSLSYLGKLPINTIKIDQSFVHTIDSNPKNLTIIKAILEMARNLKLKVIAEGVETKSQLDLLVDIGCELFQGYYFYKPLKVEETTAILRKEHLIVS